MSDIEDTLRQVMVSHDQDAPTTSDLVRALEATPAPPRRRGPGRPRPGWSIPLAAAAAVTVVVVGSIWAGGLVGSARRAHLNGLTIHAARLACPATYTGQAPWVPARPAGIDGRARLVPAATPSSALVCAYAGDNTARQQAGWALSGRRRLTGGLAELAALLSRQPRAPRQPMACTDMGGKQTNYLIGLTYPGGGRIWVTATDDPNGCVATTNGEFTSASGVGGTVTKAFATGRWPARQPVGCNRFGQDAGRLGQSAAMVPPGATSLTICTPAARTFSSGYQALISALNALPTRPSTHACSGGPGGPFYELLFAYPHGPPVEVTISANCHPAIDNNSLQSPTAHAILPLIQRLLTAT